MRVFVDREGALGQLSFVENLYSLWENVIAIETDACDGSHTAGRTSCTCSVARTGRFVAVAAALLGDGTEEREEKELDTRSHITKGARRCVF